MTRPLLEYCKNGHLMEKTRRRAESGRLYCVECSRIRDRKSVLKRPVRAVPDNIHPMWRGLAAIRVP